MPAPGGPSILHVHNRSTALARVRLHVAGRRAWDAWVAPGGAISAPPFPPQHLTLEARCRDDKTCVTYTSVLACMSTQAQVVARLVRQSEAPLFVLETVACGQPGALRIANTAPASIDFCARFHASPYLLSGFVASGATLTLPLYEGLSLQAIVCGLTVCTAMSAVAGRWSIDTPPGAAGFPVLAAIGPAGTPA